MREFFGINEAVLVEKKAFNTAVEISQQPELWQETFEKINREKEKIAKFINEKLKNKDLRIILTGAGTSAYIGDTLYPYIMNSTNKRVESIPTTTLVTNAKEFLQKDKPTLVISFARSGNSPESVGVYEICEKLIDECYQIVITCAADGALAKRAQNSENSLVILMPERSNDKGFAMTGAFTCMVLATVLIFNINNLDAIEKDVRNIIIHARRIINKEFNSIKKLVDKEYERVVYLGSGSLYGLSKEAALKNLELTSGKVDTYSESVLGFRHGPKSIMNDRTLVVVFISNDEYIRLYDRDIAREIFGDNGNHKVVAIGYKYNKEIKDVCDEYYYLDEKEDVIDILAVLDYILFAQIFSFFNSLRNGVYPDDPKPDGTVNRVVQGVNIYDI